MSAQSALPSLASICLEVDSPLPVKSFAFDPTYNEDRVYVDYTDFAVIEFVYENDRPVTRVFPANEETEILGPCVAQVSGHNSQAALAKLAALNEII